VVLLENFRAEPLMDNIEGLTALPSWVCCREWLRTDDVTHSKVQKESHP
jgi:hypothetical protein